MSAVERYTWCRAVGHTWYEADSDWTPSWGTPFTLRCERCGTERRDQIDAFGDLSARRYLQPEGYRLSRDEPKPTRPEYRLALLRQVEDRKRRKA